jgi:hypothetical protein
MPTCRGALGQAMSAGTPMKRAPKNHSILSSSNRLLAKSRVCQGPDSSVTLRLTRS